MEKPHVEAVEVDPLEAALQEATSNVVKQGRRVKGKQTGRKDDEESTDTNNAEDDEEDEDSEGNGVGAPSAELSTVNARVTELSQGGRDIRC